MANRWLKGNGYWCPTCGGSGRGEVSSTIEYHGGATQDLYYRCLTCAGQRRIALPPEEIVRALVSVATPQSSTVR